MNNVVPIRQTGPRTPAGKRRSSLNATKSGLYASTVVIRGVENEAEYRQFALAVVADLDVQGVLEMAAAERLISALWRERRIRRYEAAELSEVADHATAHREAAAEARRLADETIVHREALYKNVWSPFGKVDREQLELAAAGVGQTFTESADRLQFRNNVEDVIYGRTRRSKLREAVMQFCFENMNRDFIGENRHQTLNALIDYLWRLAEHYKIVAAEYEKKARNVETEALIPTWNVAQKVTDAERRLERQISVALSDFKAVRALRESCSETGRSMIPARAQSSR